MTIRESPPILLARAIGYRLRGRVHFPRDTIGVGYQGPGDEEFVAFRKLVLDPIAGQPAAPGAVFTVWFEFANLSIAVNKRLSLIPAPFIAAQPGFRSKTWTLGRTSGRFCGVYEWDSAADAEAYWTSFPMRMMKRRAMPGTVEHRIDLQPT